VLVDEVAATGAATWPLLGLDLVGVFVFALTGGLAGVGKRFDILGVLVLAACAGLGGGVLRDVLIGATPPVGITDWRLMASACAAGLLTFSFHPRLARIERLILVLDGLGLALFAVGGTLKALELGAEPLTAVIVGVLTGVGGGAIRDLLGGEVPRVLAHRDLYAIPALLGATAYASAWSAGYQSPLITWGCVVLIAGVRLLALRRDWKAPAPRPPRAM
jgi:uncharacterized membrane protein YeiH